LADGSFASDLRGVLDEIIDPVNAVQTCALENVPAYNWPKMKCNQSE